MTPQKRMLSSSIAAMLISMTVFASSASAVLEPNVTPSCLEDRVVNAMRQIIEAERLVGNSDRIEGLLDQLNEAVAALDGRYESDLVISCSEPELHYQDSLKTVESVKLEAERVLRDTTQIGIGQPSTQFLSVSMVATGALVTAMLVEGAVRLNRCTNAKRLRWQRLLTVYISSALVYSLLFYIAEHPRQGEQFFALSVLGSSLQAGGYYPTEQGSIFVGENVSWVARVESHASSTKLLRLAVGVGIPSESSSPSFPQKDVSMIAVYHRILREGEGWKMPLSWKLISASSDPTGKVSICMAINNIVIQPKVLSQNGKTFRIVAALWSIEPNVDAYQLRSWIQVWFSVPNYSTEAVTPNACSSNYQA